MQRKKQKSCNFVQKSVSHVFFSKSVNRVTLFLGVGRVTKKDKSPKKKRDLRWGKKKQLTPVTPSPAHTHTPPPLRGAAQWVTGNTAHKQRPYFGASSSRPLLSLSRALFVPNAAKWLDKLAPDTFNDYFVWSSVAVTCGEIFDLPCTVYAMRLGYQ